MPRFEPFAGLRYSRDHVVLDDVVAPPYDVISDEDQAALEARSPYNSVRVELPTDDPPADRYVAARRFLDDWRAEGIVERDPQPAFYGYRMRFTDESGRDRETLGVIGALQLESPGQGILPHERTMPKPKGDRLYLLRATEANLSPIWGLSLATGLSDLIPGPGPSGARCTDVDGTTHELWPVTDPAAVEAIAASVGSAAVVIADGHHRFETALAYQEERQAAAGGRPGGYDLVMALIVEVADDQLSVRAVHRLISGLPEGFDVVAALSPAFQLTPTDPPDATIGRRMLAAGSLALVTPQGTWMARPRGVEGSATAGASDPGKEPGAPDKAAAAGAATATEAAAAEQLDSILLDAALAALPPHELAYQHGWDLAAAAVTKGLADAAVLLRPASVARIAQTGRGGERMPPKTTFFWPKPRTGLVFREVDG